MPSKKAINNFKINNMNTTITKENYTQLVWDENISFEDYEKFYNSLYREEKITLLKFLIEHYPEYDTEWPYSYFDIESEWIDESSWDKVVDFSDFVRTKSPETYQKEFPYLSSHSTHYALFHGDLETAKARFAQNLVEPAKGIDSSLRNVFDVLSTDAIYKDYTTEIAKKIWQPIRDSRDLLGGAEFDYTLWLYCNHLEGIFEKIKAEEEIDWEAYKEAVKAIDFKVVKELKELPQLDISFDEKEFRKNEKYRNEQLNRIFLAFLYAAYTDLGIPVYWAFRGWANLHRYMLNSSDAPKRNNRFTFTTKMIDKMGGNLMGIWGGNKAEMVVTMWTIPYSYDFFLANNFIDKETYDRLMEFYWHVRRSLFNIVNQELWKYKGLYSWKKPAFLSEEIFEKEKELVLASINWTKEEAKQNILAFNNALPKLPDDVIPEVELSPFEKMLLKIPKSSSSTTSSSNSGSNRNQKTSKPKRQSRNQRKSRRRRRK